MIYVYRQVCVTFIHTHILHIKICGCIYHVYMTVCQNPCALALLKFPLPGNLPGIFRKPSGSAVFLLLRCWDICWHAGVACFFQFPTPVDLGVAAGGCSSGNLPEIFGNFRRRFWRRWRLMWFCSSGKSSGNLPETFRNHAFS